MLHTILLGVVKYFWGQTVRVLKKNKTAEAFHLRLGSVASSGLKDPDLRADYICQYSGSLIGKHLKSLAQVMPFLIFDLVERTLLNAWTTLGSLVALLWHTEITNTEVYLVGSIQC